MPRRRPPGLLVVAIAALVGAGVAAVALVDRSRPAAVEDVARLLAAPARVHQARSARFDLSLHFLDAESRVVIRQRGIARARGRLGRFTLTVERSGAPAQGPVEVLVDGRALFLGLPASRSVGFTGGKRWVVVDVEDPAEAATVSVEPDPLAYLEIVGGMSGRVREVGTEDVRGVATTRYRLEATLQALSARLPDDREAEVAPTLAQLGPGRLPVEVWLDARGRPRRVEVRLGGDGSRVRIRLELDGFGAPVAVDPPAPGETHEATDLHEAMGLAGL